MVEFTEVTGPATVYQVDSFKNPTPTAVPQKARSKFAEEYEVDYADCRAQLTEYLGQKVVLVGVVTNE